MKEITGIANKGKEGLDMWKRQYYSSSTVKERKDMVVMTVREKEEEKWLVRMTGFSQQGANLRWEVPQRRLKNDNILNTSKEAISLLIKAVYDLLPTPANKSKWFCKEDKCLLCGKEGTLNYLLSWCNMGLSQGHGDTTKS